MISADSPEWLQAFAWRMERWAEIAKFARRKRDSDLYTGLAAIDLISTMVEHADEVAPMIDKAGTDIRSIFAGVLNVEKKDPPE